MEVGNSEEEKQEIYEAIAIIECPPYKRRGNAGREFKLSFKPFTGTKQSNWGRDPFTPSVKVSETQSHGSPAKITRPRLTHKLTLLSLTLPTGTAGNVDRVLFKDLVEIVPLVQSLIDRKASSSFTRRGSMIYTKTPARESLSKKILDPKGRNAAQSIPTKRQRDHGDKDQGKSARNNQDGGGDSFSIFSSRALAAEKDKEELIALREQVEDLQRKLLEKDELLKSAEVTKNQITAVHAKLDELKHQAAEKDSLIKSTQLQLSDAKIKLAGQTSSPGKDTVGSNDIQQESREAPGRSRFHARSDFIIYALI
ncbi:hypothetical protein L1049_027680 [Liquidambar formosana]|uniref:Uncharacterized protein n=1 Tax=Liquidambar formosana TaxID=63359 RepID=A0AAP0WSQ2_LIQFO